MSVFVGIDPGLKGAVAAVHDGTVLAIHDAPVVKASKGHEYDYAQMLPCLSWGFERLGGVALVAIEVPLGLPPSTHNGSAYKQGQGVGLWQGIALALKYPVERVRPQVWKREMGIPKGSPKSFSRSVAGRLFPDVADQLSRVKDDGRADAILIAEWARRTHGRQEQ